MKSSGVKIKKPHGSDPAIISRLITVNCRSSQTLHNNDSPLCVSASEEEIFENSTTDDTFGQHSISKYNTDFDHTSNISTNPKRSPTFGRAFGPKIERENIPGTPMIGIEFIQDTILKAEHKHSQNMIVEEDLVDVTSKKDFGPNNFRNDINGVNIIDNLIQKSFDDCDRRSSKQDKEGLDPESLMFRDGRRKIDMVLAWEEEYQGVMTETEARRREYRRCFQENLEKEGLEVELEDKSQAFDEKTYFLKIHLPWRLESRYAEVMNLKLPIKRFITISVKAWDEENIVARNLVIWKRWISRFTKLLEHDDGYGEEEATFRRATAGANAEEQFIVKDRGTAYTSAQRSLIVMQILLRTKFDDTEKCGIRRLLNDGAYLACFPLHEGRYDRAHSSGAIFDRRVLYLTWAHPSQWYKRQPLCLVRKYFGDKIALYFCWLGFYTKMLLYPAVVGTLCFFYGLVSMDSTDNMPSREICDDTGAGNITLCPLCDAACSYQKLYDSCLFARLTYLFDNPSTVFFAIFMSFWATTFLELWKRKQSVIVWEWDLQNTEADEENRPEFETSVKTFRMNPVTREKEPYMPTWNRALRFIAAGSVVLFMFTRRRVSRLEDEAPELSRSVRDVIEIFSTQQSTKSPNIWQCFII